ncbi:Arm DNA-binding domain-containing protein [Desulfobotulus mexicanus]|uniref:DUF4102 domain-containing protein n=1 Tax=Desulfobotulus mexicanus TaxID=2586642 RepID=A0A5S5MCN6_9BACT|nr:Arm DNA-binding domain-containing protein [Desulfobotulus mexicanus]TYT73474.1 DUF4102 domain-containing protein [Desulfobotulus mexicanus]
MEFCFFCESIIYDTEITGFVLEVRHTGTKTYYLKYRNKRKEQRQYKIGDEKSLTFTKASQAARKIRSRVVIGEDPVDDRKQLCKMMTLEAFVQSRYIPFVQGYNLDSLLICIPTTLNAVLIFCVRT